MRHFSPLRYPGGKGRLSPFVQRIFWRTMIYWTVIMWSHMRVDRPVGLSLLLLEYASRIYINDISKPVYLFWKAVLDDTDAMCRKIRDKKVTPAEWKRQRNILFHYRDHSRVSVAFSMFFLNRTNRSGIIHSGGMIGGNDQTGNWKIDARYNKPELISRIEAIAAYSGTASGSVTKTLKCFVKGLDARTSTQESEYSLTRHILSKGRVSMRTTISRKTSTSGLQGVFMKETARRNWIISYDNHPQIRKAYRGCKKLVYSLPYSAARKYEGSGSHVLQ